MCPKRVPYTFRCWPEEDPSGDTLEIEGGMQLRGGSRAAAPLVQYDDPYAED